MTKLVVSEQTSITQMVSKEEIVPMENEGKIKSWLKRIGLAGFLFFLIKGLLWIFLGKEVIEAIFG